MAETVNLKLPLIDNSMVADVVRDFNALAQDLDSKVMPKTGGVLDTSSINVTDNTRTLRLWSDSTSPALGTTTNHDLRIVSNNIERGRVTTAGSLVWIDRILTGRNGLQIGQHGDAARNFHMVSDDVGTNSAFRIYNGTYGAGKRVFGVDDLGHVMIGDQTAVLNLDGWSRVVDIYKPSNGHLTLRTDQIQATFAVHDNGFYGSSKGLMVGTWTNHDVSIVVNKSPRLIISASGGLVLPVGGFTISSNTDNVITLSNGSIAGTNYGIKQIINSVNDAYNGNSIIFRARKADDSILDIKMNYSKGGGDIMTEGHVVKSTAAPSGGFDGMIWIQYA